MSRPCCPSHGSRPPALEMPWPKPGPDRSQLMAPRGADEKDLMSYYGRGRCELYTLPVTRSGLHRISHNAAIGIWGKEIREPRYDSYVVGDRIWRVFKGEKTGRYPRGQRQAAAIALRAACSGMANTRQHTQLWLQLPVHCLLSLSRRRTSSFSLANNSGCTGRCTTSTPWL